MILKCQLRNNNKTYDYFKGYYAALNDYFATIDWDLLFDSNSISKTGIFLKKRSLKGVKNLFPCHQYFTRSQLLHLELYLEKVTVF